MTIEEITVEQLKTLLDEKADISLIDVREEDEYAVTNIKQATLLPLSRFAELAVTLDKSKAYVIHCKLGGRSAQATHYLLDQGFKSVKNVIGGITAWDAAGYNAV
ncbi:rhodanese-like domain-containing protein [bacterium]|jgi:sulfur-carrier protein adenylyltransferase/sulfurtransferase|nr:rhodanese-like domain-containing protein [bacterium]